MTTPDGRTEDGRVAGEDERRRRVLGSLVTQPDVDRWVDLSVPGRVRIRTGKAELGQGIRTALTLLAAEELGVDPSMVDVVPATTAAGPDEGFTAGSRSVEQSGVAVRQACAHVRRLLVERAAARLVRAKGDLVADRGLVGGPDGPAISYWDLAAEGPFAFRVQQPAPLRAAGEHRYVGRGMQRVDLRAKIGGAPAYVADLRLPDMRFARVVRPPHLGATLAGPTPVAVGDARVVSVIFSDSVGAARTFQATVGATWPTLQDPSGAIALAYGVRNPPSTFLIAPDGKVVAFLLSSVTQRDLDALIVRAQASGA